MKKNIIWIVVLLLISSTAFASSLVTDVTSEIKGNNAGNLGSYFWKFHYTDDTFSNSTEQSALSHETYNNATFINPTQNKQVDYIELYIKSLVSLNSLGERNSQIKVNSISIKQNLTIVSTDSETYVILKNISIRSQVDYKLISDWFLNDTNIATGNVTNTGNVTDSYGSNNGQYFGRSFNHGVITNATYVNSNATENNNTGNALEFDGLDDYVNITDSTSILNIFNNGGSSSVWIKPQTGGTGGSGRILNKRSANNGWYIETREQSGSFVKIRFLREFSITDGIWDSPSANIPINEWTHISIAYNDSSENNTPTIYVNGVNYTYFQAQAPDGNSLTDLAHNLCIGSVGEMCEQAISYNGTIDEPMLFNRSLSQSEIQAIYNAGIPTQNNDLVGYWDFNEGSGTTAYDNNHLTQGFLNVNPSQRAIGFDGIDDYVSIPSKTYDLDSGSTFSFWAKRNRISDNHVIFGGNVNTYKFIILSIQNVIQVETDTNADTCLSSALDDTTKWHYYTISIKDYNCTIYQDGIDKTNIASNPINNNITLQAIGKAPAQFFMNGSISNVRIYNRSLNDYEIKYLNWSGTGESIGIKTFTANNSINGTLINSFTITATKDTGQTQSGSTTNGNLTLTLLSGNYSIKISSSTYVNVTKDIEVTGNSNSITNYEMYKDNSILLYFRDSLTNDLITDRNVSIEYIGDINSGNLTNGTGSIFISNLTVDTYTLQYTATGYVIAFSEFNITNEQTSNLTLYLLNTTDYTEVDIEVVDESGDSLEGAVVTVQRFDVLQNAYLDEETVTTNFEGKSRVNIVLETEFYRFAIEYPAGTTRTITEPTRIFETTISFQIRITDQILEEYEKFLNVDYDLIFNDETNNFRFEYNDPESNLEEVCVKVYKINLKSRTLYNDTCVSSSSATILLGVDNVTGRTYRADTYFNFGEDDRFITSLSKTFKSATIQTRDWLLWDAFITMTLLLLFFVYPPLALALIMFPTLVLSMIGLLNLNIGIAISLQIVFVILGIGIGIKGR